MVYHVAQILVEQAQDIWTIASVSPYVATTERLALGYVKRVSQLARSASPSISAGFAESQPQALRLEQLPVTTAPNKWQEDLRRVNMRDGDKLIKYIGMKYRGQMILARTVEIKHTIGYFAYLMEWAKINRN